MLVLARAFAPAIRQSPKDVWINLRIRYRAAILKDQGVDTPVARIQFAIHYVWDAPSKSDLKWLKPKWARRTIKRQYEKRQRHVRLWGPGDVELVKMILQRDIGNADLSRFEPADFYVHEIRYRTGAHYKGVLDQMMKGNWTKLGNIQVPYDVRNDPFDMRGARPILTMDSPDHHSFHKPDDIPAEVMGWPVIVPGDVRYFSKKEWRYFMISENGRGSEPWELG